MIKITDLSVGYPGGQRDVLHQIDLSVEPGQFLTVMGPNGSGKTTLLRTIAGALKPREGSVEIAGKNRFSMRPREFASMVSVMMDEMTPTGISVRDYLLLSRSLLRGDLAQITQEDLLQVQNALANMDLERVASTPLEHLSAGQLQRARVARVLAQARRIALLDEPTAHLDPKHAFSVLSALRHMCRSGGLCVVVLHDLSLARLYADTGLLLLDGRVFAAGSIEKTLSPENIHQVFGVMARVDSSGFLRVVPPGYGATASGGSD